MVFALVRGCGGLYDWLVIAHVEMPGRSAMVRADIATAKCSEARRIRGSPRPPRMASHGRLCAHAAHAGHSHPRRSQLPTPVTAAPQPTRAHRRRRRRCKKVFSERRGIRGGTVTSDRNYPLAAPIGICVDVYCTACSQYLVGDGNLAATIFRLLRTPARGYASPGAGSRGPGPML